MMQQRWLRLLLLTKRKKIGKERQRRKRDLIVWSVINVREKKRSKDSELRPMR